MKKIFTLILCLVSLGASAQPQVKGDFDAAWVDCVPFVSGSYAAKATGTQPVGWTAANVMGYYLNLGFLGGSWTGTTQVVSQTTGRNGAGYAAVMSNKEQMDNKIPGYMAIGTPWNTANTFGANADGGTFGGLSFSNRPDAIQFYYKRSASDASQPATVVAYLWSGSWTQADVPANVASSATKITMTDRDRNVIGMNTSLGGTVTSNNGKFIASLGTDSLITETASEWTSKTISFKYKDKNAIPEKINIIFAANDYFGDKGNIATNNSLTIDDVTLIYNSSLSDLQFNSTTIEGFAKDTYEYTIDDAYTEGCIEFTKDCVGGTVEEGFDPSSNSYIITVKGDDYDSNPSNTHTYTVKFTKVIINDGDDITKVNHISGGTVVLNRKFKAGWNTVCLPFPVRYDKLGTNVTTYILSTPSGDAITFSKTTSNIVKNTPFLANFPSEVNSITFTSRTINEDKTPLVKTCGDWTFTGSYEPSISMEGKWGVVNNGSKVRKGGAGSTLKSTRAYLEYNGTANVNEMRIIIDGEETTITEIDGMPVGNFDVYNLQGVRVRQNVNSLNGLRKGIYIVNGKKYIVK